MLTLLVCAVPAAAAPAETTPPDQLIAERIWGDEILFSTYSRELSEEDQQFFARRIDVTARVLAANAANLPADQRDSYVEQVLTGRYGVMAELQGEIDRCARYGIRPLRPLRPHVPGELYLPSWLDWPGVGFLAILIITICVYFMQRLRRRT